MQASETEGLLLRQEIGQVLAERLIRAAHRRAAEMGVAIAAAVVDRGGRIVAVVRMDGTALCGVPIAIDKAYSAVACAAPTHQWAESTMPWWGGLGYEYRSAWADGGLSRRHADRFGRRRRWRTWRQRG